MKGSIPINQEKDFSLVWWISNCLKSYKSDINNIRTECFTNEKHFSHAVLEKLDRSLRHNKKVLVIHVILVIWFIRCSSFIFQVIPLKYQLSDSGFWRVPSGNLFTVNLMLGGAADRISRLSLPVFRDECWPKREGCSCGCAYSTSEFRGRLAVHSWTAWGVRGADPHPGENLHIIFDFLKTCVSLALSTESVPGPVLPAPDPLRIPKSLGAQVPHMWWPSATVDRKPYRYLLIKTPRVSGSLSLVVVFKGQLCFWGLPDEIEAFSNIRRPF